MHKIPLASALFALSFSMSLHCQAQTAAPSSPQAIPETDTQAETVDSDCESWRAVAAGHWNNRIYRLNWKYPDAPYFGDLPAEIQTFVLLKYCQEGVDWVSDNPGLVNDIMQRKWPVKQVK